MAGCPRCRRSSHTKYEVVVSKNKKKWVIESCFSCGFNLEIHDYVGIKKAGELVDTVDQNEENQ